MPSIHEDIVNYLRQQREVFGQRLYVDTIDVEAFDIPWTQEADVDSTPSVGTLIQETPMAVSDDGWKEGMSLEEYGQAISSCLKCPLGHSRTKFVFGSGNPSADVLVIGEAPGADEDEAGLPFVGRAGQLLTKILESVNFSRDEVYICNILKCRPPNNRKPLVSETDQCEPYLKRQIDLVQPRYILCLGLTAASTLLRTKQAMKDLRGKTLTYEGIPTVVTYHPAALLRNPEWKRDTWEDMKRLRALVDAHD